eukprot:6181745-Amphidinium_carterae.1
MITPWMFPQSSPPSVSTNELNTYDSMPQRVYFTNIAQECFKYCPKGIAQRCWMDIALEPPGLSKCRPQWKYPAQLQARQTALIGLPMKAFWSWPLKGMGNVKHRPQNHARAKPVGKVDPIQGKTPLHRYSEALSVAILAQDQTSGDTNGQKRQWTHTEGGIVGRHAML